jgi:hypothetical protein
LLSHILLCDLVSTIGVGHNLVVVDMRPRRHSSSAAGASNVARRSSVSSRDIQLVQQQLAFKRQYQRLFASQHIIVVILVGAPLIIFLFNHCLMKLDGSIRKVS